MKHRFWILAALLALVAGFLLGRGGAGRTSSSPGSQATAAAAAEREETWTCSMHPQIRQPRPGKCPLCAMDLIPVTSDTGTTLPRQLRLSPAARRLAELALAPVERRAVAVEVRMVGKVQFDETRLATIAPRVPGRIDRLYANFTGVQVKAGDHLADMYSPDLLAAQQELLQASRASGASFLLAATRERLRLWGLTAAQIAEIERSGDVREHVTFYAPIGGIVVEMAAREGQYVETGMRLFSVADLTHVWVLLDAYETDLAMLRYAQDVEFQVEAYPGETFKGIVAFIDPLLDPLTRTAKVRVNVPNPDGRLKPEMFVRAQIHAPLDADGMVVSRNLSGKWISPMHPEIVKDGPGRCDVCGMPLVRAEELGYAAATVAESALPLVVPATAPLLTGRRAVVYVAMPDEQDGLYEGREVILGPRAGAWFLVREGLSAGERVVVNGNFKLDSAMQIQAKPSMMSAGAPRVARHAVDPSARLEAFETGQTFKTGLAAVYAAYFAMQQELAADRLAPAQRAARALFAALRGIDAAHLEARTRHAWEQEREHLEHDLKQFRLAEHIDDARVHFEPLSQCLIVIAKQFGTGGDATVLYQVHCPMAFDDRGADWLQNGSDIANPYFGAAMFGCGFVVQPIGAVREANP